MEQVKQIIETQGMRLFGGILALAIGFFIVHWIVKLMDRSPRLAKIEPTLRGFLKSLIKCVLYVVVILTAASIMGIPLTSFITLLASAGVAISLAMQGALGNFVGGLTILLLKQFRVGEYVKVGDVDGTVRNIGILYTELTTPDNRHISMPNSSLTNTAIINYSREGTRRMDVNFSVSYGADISHVRETLMSVVRRCDTLSEPAAPVVLLSECADSSVQFTVRLWCKTADYWNIYYFLLEEGKRALDSAGIEIPFPQMDVHIR